MTGMLPPVTGYLDRLSRRPGERITAHVSLRRPGPCRARLVRVVSADPNPAGPGLDLRPVVEAFDHRFEGQHQPVQLGSWGLVQGSPQLEPGQARCWAVLVQLLAELPAATVLAAEGGQDSIVIRAGAEGAEAEITLGATTTWLRTETPLRTAVWYRLWLSHDPATGRVALGQAPLEAAADVAMATAQAPAGQFAPVSAVTFAARDAMAPRDHFTGKVEDPLVAAAFVEAWPDPSTFLPQRKAFVPAGTSRRASRPNMSRISAPRPCTAT
ncbi:hypothetical protein ACFQU7_30225 [Pseudoroseomonas wenyumeiae]